MIRTMADLVHPGDPAELIAAAVEHRRLLMRTDRQTSFASLLPWSTIDKLITTEALMGGLLRPARKGIDLPLNMVMALDRKRGGWMLKRDKLQALRHQGLSLVIDRIDEQVPEIGAMNALLERHLRCPIWTNCYISFNRDSAFNVHWDDHNVLILQIHGRKRWMCYGQPYRFPVRSPAHPMPSVPGTAEWEVVLEPGDVLYVPRGEVHKAEVVGAESVHLTVGIAPPRGGDVLRWLAERALSDETVRRDINPLDRPEELSERNRSLKATFHRFIDEIDIATFLADQDRSRSPYRPDNIGSDFVLDPETLVRPALKRILPLPEGGRTDVEVRFGEVATRLNSVERAVLARLLEKDTVSVRHLIESFEGVAAEEITAGITSLSRKCLVFLSIG